MSPLTRGFLKPNQATWRERPCWAGLVSAGCRARPSLPTPGSRELVCCMCADGRQFRSLRAPGGQHSRGPGRRPSSCLNARSLPLRPSLRPAFPPARGSPACFGELPPRPSPHLHLHSQVSAQQVHHVSRGPPVGLPH